ncbi:MAG: hypothetical protein ACOCXA_04670 [Planctomycetota bacterium]
MLNHDYRDLLNIFNDAKVDYMVVGAYAMAAHGYLRATGDIDIFINIAPDNVRAVFNALATFGAPLRGIKAEDFLEPGTVYQIGVPPNRIDILNQITGVSFSECEPVVREVDGLRIPFIDKASLIKNKQSTGRAKDKIDVEFMNESP